MREDKNIEAHNTDINAHKSIQTKINMILLHMKGKHYQWIEKNLMRNSFIENLGKGNILNNL